MTDSAWWRDQEAPSDLARDYREALASGVAPPG